MFFSHSTIDHILYCNNVVNTKCSTYSARSPRDAWVKHSQLILPVTVVQFTLCLLSSSACYGIPSECTVSFFPRNHVSRHLPCVITVSPECFQDFFASITPVLSRAPIAQCMCSYEPGEVIFLLHSEHYSPHICVQFLIVPCFFLLIFSLNRSP